MPRTKTSPAAPPRPEVPVTVATPDRTVLAQLGADLTTFLNGGMRGAVTADLMFGGRHLSDDVKRFYRRADDAAVLLGITDVPIFPSWTTIAPEQAEAELRHLRAWAVRHVSLGTAEIENLTNLNQCSHADDFSVVTWCGERFAFDGDKQRQAVRVLWADWIKTRGAGLRDLTIGERIDHDSDRFRLANLFRGHAALGRMIRKRGRGSWALVPLGPDRDEW